MTMLEPAERMRLRQFLMDRFSLDGLKELAFDLGVDHQRFPHETIGDFARELISHFERRSQLGHLVAEALQRRHDDDLAPLAAKLEKEESVPPESSQQINTGPQIDNPKHLPLSPEEEEILKIMFVSYQRVTIRDELHRGFSGSRVFIVRPIGSESSPDLPAVVKIGPLGLIQKEWQAYQEHVRLKVPGIAEITDEPVFHPDSLWGGLRYTLMGEGGTFEVESLYDYCHDASIADIRYVLEERLFRVVGPNWWQFNEAKADWPVQASCDFLFPVNLLIEPVTPPPDIIPHLLRPNAFPDRPLLKGDYVRLEGFVVTEVGPKQKAVTLNVPRREDGLPASYRLRLQPVESTEAYQVGREIAPSTGRVRQTRYEQLRDNALEALEHRFDVTADPLTASDGTTLPNPVAALATLMGRTRDVRVSCIHGDLNMDNILVEPGSRRVSLIDFATARRDHALHDLLRLETQVVTRLLPQALSDVKPLVKTIETFYKRLHKATSDPKQPVSTRAYKAELDKPFEMLMAIRHMARQCLFDPGDWTEYYEGLILYLLGALKFKDLARLPREVAFWTAAAAYDLVEPASVRDKSAPRDWSRLDKYLPEEMYQKKQEAVCLKHLNALLRAVSTYLPRDLALDLLRKPVVAQNKGQFLQGTLLFADISDFTTLAERLQREGGDEGAEELVGVINRYLGVMLPILSKYGGSLVKFGGDGMLCLFTGEGQGAMNAVWAAWEMKQAMADRLAEIEMFQEIYPLEMKVGSSSGLLFAATVGAKEHMEYVLTGSAVERTARAESAASKGDVLISAETYALVQGNLEAEALTGKPEFYRITGIRSKPTSELLDPWNEIKEYLSVIENDLWEVVDRLDALSPYLPAGVLPQLVYDPQEGQFEGEYRQVTVLFANFTGMADIIHARGVKDETGIANDLSEYFQAMQEEVEYYGGVINKVDLYDQGDKLMVLFGAPMTHELDAQRAALTAMAMQKAMSRLKSPALSAFLSQRIGIHTGLVFAGNVGSSEHNRREYTVMGHTVNLAARLMSQTPSGQAWVSECVWDQIQGYFEATALPPVDIKGVEGPIGIYQLLAARPGVSRVRVRLLSSEIMGRDAELAELQGCLDDLSLDGWRQVVVVTGEAGVGKTRLIEEWRRRLAKVEVTWLSACGHSYGQETHGVFVMILERLLGFGAADSEDVRWTKLAARVGQIFRDAAPGYLPDLSETLAHLGMFLHLDLSKRQGLDETVVGLDAETLRLKTRLAICNLLTHAARERPLCLVLEDLHWADEASLDMLKFVVDKVDVKVPILFCLSFRPQKEQPIWSTWKAIEQSCPECHSIALQELEEADSRRLLSNLLNTSALPSNFQDLVLAAANGNPLYVEEILHALIEDGTIARSEEGWQVVRHVEHIHVPTTLQQIIQSRIDELDFASPGARRVLWMAAVIGEVFAQDLLQDLFTSTGRQPEELWRHLRELRRAGMIEPIRIESSVPSSGGPRRGYQFRHGLVRQVAYENMLVARRREYHCRVGRWLEEKYSENLQRHYDTLAYHYDQGQEWAKAFQYHWLTGQRDARSYANLSAIFHLRRALEIAGYEAQGIQVVGQVHFELGKVLAITGEFDAALEHLTSAWDVLEHVPGQDATLQRARVSYEIGRIYQRMQDSENLGTALEWQARGMALLPKTPTTEAVLLHLLRACVHDVQREWDDVDRECRQALELAQQVGAKAEHGLIYRAWADSARARGRLDLALEYCQKGIEVCQELSDLIGLSNGYANRGYLAVDTGDWPLAETSYLAALEIQERIGDKFQIAVTCSNLGDLYYHLGKDLDRGSAYAERALSIFTQLRAAYAITAHVVLATLYLRQGNLRQARQQLSEARELLETLGATMFEPTVGRWSVEVHLAEGNLAQAEHEIQPLLALPKDELDIEFEPVQRLWGRILAARGEMTEAIRVLQESLERLEKDQNRYELGCTLLVLAEMLAQIEDRVTDAMAHAQRARTMFDRLGARSDMEEADRVIARLLVAQSRWAVAIEILEANAERLEQGQVPYHLARTWLTLASVLADTAGRTEEALAYVRRARTVFADLDTRLDLEEADRLIVRLVQGGAMSPG